MKKVLNILLLLTAVFTYSSCTNEVDDIFDKDSALRMNEKLAETKTLLESAPNGWIMRYYGNTAYGGWNLLCKFENGKVTAASDYLTKKTFDKTTMTGEYKEATSEYHMKQSAGALLSFDGYNEIIHFFSNPVNEITQGINNGEGFGGDFEFRVLKTSQDTILLSGKKHKTRIVMIRMRQDMTWQDYLNKVIEREDEMNFGQYKYVGDSTTIVTSSMRNLIYTYTDPETGEEVRYRQPYVPTLEGFEFYGEWDLLGHKSKRMIYKGGDDFMFENQDGTAKMYGVTPPLVNYIYDGSTWFLSHEKMGTEPQIWMDLVREAIKSQTKEQDAKDIYTTYLQGAKDTKVGTYYLNVGRGFLVKFKFKVVGIGDNQVRFEHPMKLEDKVAQKLFKAITTPVGWNLIKPFTGEDEDGNFLVESKAVVFDITTDNPKYPTYLKLVSTTNPEHFIVLSKAEQNFYTTYEE